MIYHDYIKYNNKEYQLSCSYVNYTYELMVFPIENGIVSGHEVYCHRTTDFNSIMSLYNLILENPSLYLNQKIIEEYLDSKEEDFKTTDLHKYEKFLNDMNINFKTRDYHPKDKTPLTVLSVCDEHLDSRVYGACVDIVFDLKTGKFMFFSPSGD